VISRSLRITVALPNAIGSPQKQRDFRYAVVPSGKPLVLKETDPINCQVKSSKAVYQYIFG
jgi:hypothetical protein